MPSNHAKSSSKKVKAKKAKGQCHGCDQCDGTCRGALALYRNSVFTGFVMPEGGEVTDARRLHEVGGSLEGPSHKAEPLEFVLSMRAHGGDDAPPEERIPPMPGVLSPCCADCYDKAVANIDPQGLVFGPFGFAQSASGRSYFEAVRFDDKVYVKVEGTFIDVAGETKRAREGFFARVLGVLPATGECVVLPNPTELHWLSLDVDIIYRVPHTAVLAVERGSLW